MKHVVNDKVPSTASPTSLFRYSYYEADGELVQDTRVLGTDNRRRVVSPSRSICSSISTPPIRPSYTELQTTAQLRNQ